MFDSTTELGKLFQVDTLRLKKKSFSNVLVQQGTFEHYIIYLECLDKITSIPQFLDKINLFTLYR